MTQYSYPWTAVGGDRTRSADTAADIYGSTIPTGVIDGLVVAANGANVDVTSGVAMVHGRFYRSTATESLAYTANVKAYIVLRMTAADRAVVLAKLDGNSSAFPTVTQTDAVYEIAIASVDTTSGVVVVDTRYLNSICGMYAQPGTDTGWRYLGEVRYRKIGNVVYADWHRVTTIAADSTQTIGTLPVGFRPERTIAASIQGESNKVHQGSINNAGNISVWNTATSSSTHFGSLTFIV